MQILLISTKVSTQGNSTRQEIIVFDRLCALYIALNKLEILKILYRAVCFFACLVDLISDTDDR